MTHKPQTEFDEISYLLKSIEWQAPRSDLGYRIQNAVAGNSPLMNEMNIVHFKSPVLTMMAVLLALFLGLASGIMAGDTASATESGQHPYGNANLSVTGIYSGQVQ